MKDNKAYQLNAIKLAYIGDAVFSLFVREYYTMHTEMKNSMLNKKVNSIVCAKNQARLLPQVLELLDEEEKDIAIRARNAHTNNKAKNSTFTEYNLATQFEAVVGYIYLTGDKQKLEKILNLALEQE